jgi:hypothetical protein
VKSDIDQEVEKRFRNLPRGIKDILFAKLDALDALGLTPDGAALYEWRTTPPRVSQKDVGALLAVSGSLLSQIEAGNRQPERLTARLRKLVELLKHEKSQEEIRLAAPVLRVELSPEERLAAVFLEFRGIFNSLRPQLGIGMLEPRFESLLVETEKALLPLHKQAIQLSRNTSRRSNADHAG